LRDLDRLTATDAPRIIAFMKREPASITLVGALSVLASLSVDCGSNNSGISIAQACADVALARCNLGSQCSEPPGTPGTGFNILESYGDQQTCLTRQTLACSNGLMAPATGNSPAKVEKCVAEFNTYTCQDFYDNDPPADCTATGSRANGSGCTFNGQCTSGYCQGTKSSICGTCADAPAAGADCSSSTCAPGQRCIAASLQCQIPLPLGDTTCDASHPCDQGLVCVGNDTATMTTGTCETAGTQIGQACGGTMPGCDPTLGLYCGGPTGSKTCLLVAYGTASADAGTDGSAGSADAGGGSGAGVPCGLLADGTRHGCVAGSCYTAAGAPATGSDLGACKPFAPDNMPCDSAQGPDCLPPARCVVVGIGTAGTCLVPTASMCPS
jgi:hypothetical protein